MIEDNRINTFSRPCLGEKNGSAKLRYKDVLDIRKNYKKRKVALSKFADKYGVSIQTIHRAANGTNWANTQ